MSASVRRRATCALALVLFAILILLQASAQTAWAAENSLTTTGLSGTLSAQAIPDPYKTSDGLVEIKGATAGDVTYDTASKTLTINNVKASTLTVLKKDTLAIKLEGDNTVNVTDGEVGASLVVSGTGSLSGSIYAHGDLTVKEGTLNAYQRNDDDNAFAIRCETFFMLGGVVNSKADSVNSDAHGVLCENLEMKGGTLTAVGGSDGDWSFGLHCWNNATVSGGKLSARAGNVENPDPGKDYSTGCGIRCKKLTISGGSVELTAAKNNYDGTNYGAYCDTGFELTEGTLIAHAGADAAGIFDAFGIHTDGELAIKGGTFEADANSAGRSNGVYCKEALITGGTIKAKGYGDENNSCGFSCGGDVKMTGGALTATGTVDAASLDGGDGCGLFCEALRLAGGKLKAIGYGVEDTDHKSGAFGEGVFCTTLVVSKGTLVARGSASSRYKKAESYGVFCDKNITLKGGKVSVSNVKSASGGEENKGIACGKLLVKGGSASVANCEGTGISCSSLTMTKGALSVSNQKIGSGIRVESGNLKMTGGTLTVQKSYANAVMVEFGTKGKKIIGGKATITGGKVVAQTRKPAKRFAIGASSISCKTKCIKSVKGAMAPGFVFKYKGNTYKCKAHSTVKLVKYGPKKLRFKTVTYGKHKYKVK